MSGASVTYALTATLLCHLLVPGASLQCYKCDSGRFTADQPQTKCVSELSPEDLRTFPDPGSSEDPGSRGVLPSFCTAIFTQTGNFYQVVRDGFNTYDHLKGELTGTCQTLLNLFSPICDKNYSESSPKEFALRSSNVTFCSTNSCNSAPMIALSTPPCNCTSTESAPPCNCTFIKELTPPCNCTSIQESTDPSNCTSIQKSTGSCNCTSIRESANLCGCTSFINSSATPCNCTLAQGLTTDSCNPAPVQRLSLALFLVLCGFAVLGSLYPC